MQALRSHAITGSWFSWRHCVNVDRSALIPGFRKFSESVKFDGTADDIAELLDKHLAKPEKRDDAADATKLLTLRLEAIHLYRQIVRYSILFDWTDEKGELWRDKLRKSARHEFEVSKHERSPETITRLLVTGRDGVNNVMQRFLHKKDTLESQQTGPIGMRNPYMKR